MQLLAQEQVKLNFGFEMKTGVIPKLSSDAAVIPSVRVYQKVLRFPNSEHPTVFQYVCALYSDGTASRITGPATWKRGTVSDVVSRFTDQGESLTEEGSSKQGA